MKWAAPRCSDAWSLILAYDGGKPPSDAARAANGATASNTTNKRLIMAGHPCWNRLGRIEPRPECHGGTEREVDEGEHARHQRLRLAAGLHAQPTPRSKHYHQQIHTTLGDTTT